MSSTRLPGKVLAEVAGKPVLALLVERLSSVAPVVVATTAAAADGPIRRVTVEAGAAYVEGPDDDLMARHALVMRETSSDALALVGADDPLTDPALVRATLAALRGRAYARTAGWPLGLNVWAWTRDAMDAGDREAVAEDEREHVVPFWERRPDRFAAALVTRHDDAYDRYRVTVDRPADLDLVRRVAAALYPADPRFGAEDVIAFLDAHPDVAAINADGLHGYAARDAIYDLTPVPEPLPVR